MSRPVTVPFLILKRLEVCCGDAKNILRSHRSKFLNYSQRYGEENIKRGEKRRNRRWADWFHTWKANTEPLVLPTKRLDSARRPGPEPERELVVQPYLPCAATQPSPSRLSITPENIPTPLSYAPKSQNAYYCAQSDQRFSWPHSFQCLATPGAGQAADTRSNLGELPDSTVMSGLQAAQLPTEYNTCTGTRTLLRHIHPHHGMLVIYVRDILRTLVL